MGDVGANGSEAGESLCGIPGICEKVEGKKSEGRFVAEDGGGKIPPGSGTQLFQTYLERRKVTVTEKVELRPIFDLCKRDTGYVGGGKAPGVVVETCGSKEITEGYGRRDFGGGKGATAMGTRKAWQERGRVRRWEHRHRRVGERSGTLV